jgi:probable HAF family extracellular repeat protein
MKPVQHIALLAAALAACSAPACAEPGFWLTDWAPGSNFSTVTGLTSNGSVAVGYSISGQRIQGFAWTQEQGRMDFGGYDTRAFGISSDGTSVVGSTSTEVTPSRPYRRVGPGPFEDLGLLPNYTRGRSSGVSGDGSIVVGTNERGSMSSVDGQAFRWTPQTGVVGLGYLRTQGTYSEALAISRDGTTIVGNSQSFGSGGPFEAYYWREGIGMQALPGLPNAPAVSTHAYATSADGRFVVGDALATLSTYRAIRWTTDGGMLDLGTLSGYRVARAFGVSDDGRTVAGNLSSSSTLPSTAFVWTEGLGMELMSVFLARNGVVMPNGVIITQCNAVSGDGLTFAGVAFRSDLGSQGFVATIPGPSVLMVLGLRLLTVTRRRRP